ncbi:hypothetical protein EXIGLDRAFT_729430 [Exidia glandulosa HHB12029]|uniref:Uncharacterized protein n=1 Tax=Exidia glandulosa HHB12029 TaxID=1314781 RepID=A0A165LJ03_EXIGL|nr:hypothetical protein EXIGLDRAFT_729430 [Exidia glandulosa HHB12029]
MLLPFALCVLFTTLLSANALFQAHTPIGLIECELSQLSWEGSEGPVQVQVFPAGNESASPLETLPTVAGGSVVTWLVDVPAGVQYSFGMGDSTGVTVFTGSALVGANPSGDTSCEGKNDQELSAASSPTAAASTPGIGGSTAQAPSTQTPNGDGNSANTLSGESSKTSRLDPASTTPSNTPVASNDTPPAKHSSVVGPVIGIVVSLIVVTAAIGAVLCIRRRKRKRSLHYAPEDVVPMAGSSAMLTAPATSTTRTRSDAQMLSNEHSQPPPREQTLPRPTSTGKRPLIVMSADDDEPYAPTSQQLATLGEENAMLRAVIARMQRSLPPPADSETLPSYDSRSTYSS